MVCHIKDRNKLIQNLGGESGGKTSGDKKYQIYPLKDKFSRFSYSVELEDKLILASSRETAAFVIEVYEDKLPSLAQIAMQRDNEDVLMYFNLKLLTENMLPLIGILLKGRLASSPLADTPTAKELNKLLQKQRLETITARIKDINSFQGKIYLEAERLRVKGVLKMINPLQGAPQELSLLASLPPRVVFALNSLAYWEEALSKSRELFASLKQKLQTLPPAEREKVEQELGKLESSYLSLMDGLKRSFTNQICFALIPTQNVTPDFLCILPLKDRKHAHTFVKDMLSLKFFPQNLQQEKLQCVPLGVEKYKGENIFGYRIQSPSGLLAKFPLKELVIYYTLTPDYLIASGPHTNASVKAAIDLQGKEDNFYKRVFADLPLEADGKVYCSLSGLSQLVIHQLKENLRLDSAEGSIPEGGAGVWKVNPDGIYFEGYARTEDLQGIVGSIKGIAR